MRRTLLLVLATASLPAFAGPPARPAKVDVCAACHGDNGVAKAPIYPNLAGQYVTYIENALHAYHDGTRKNPIMNAQAATLSDTDIKQLAAWFSSQAAKVYTPSSADK